MEKLLELYHQVIEVVNGLDEKIRRTEDEIRKRKAAASFDSSARIEKLKEQLVKIDDYLLRVRGFQELAKKNLSSQNVLTIEAPPGYRVNLNRLRNWAMMIDPSSDNDPYAQRVYVVAKCDECFLLKKQAEFTDRVKQLENDQDDELDSDLARLNQRLSGLRKELKSFAMSETVAEFCRRVVEANENSGCTKTPLAFTNKTECEKTVFPGCYSVSLPFGKDERLWLKNMLGEYYNVSSGCVSIPVGISNEKEFIMTVTCSPANRKKLDKAMQSLILSTINSAPAGAKKIHVIDGLRFNTSSVDSLRSLEGTFAMASIPRNPDQLTSTLEEIVSSFADIDELIESYDSVSEYNAACEPSKRIPLSLVLVFGWPGAYDGKDRELLQRMMTNYERYGLSVVAVTYKNSEKTDDSEKKAMPEYAQQNAIHVSYLQNTCTISFPDGTTNGFSWYMFNDTLSEDYVKSLLNYKPADETIGNEYIKRYSLTDIPEYTRKYKKIELPFGVDGKDTAHSASFENENFATYLVGASGSGKSTLIHTLIAGLIRNYHPDNVELWLADFKQLEFKRYINHMPPHVKYVLLDESEELVFDLIDKLTAEMMERQKLFSRLGVQRIDQVDVTKLDKPLPVIFVILDEFSIMSQSIAESQIYKLRLQNILAKGRALGLKFVFASQTFTMGVVGLTPTARAQIQQRISMKGSKEEISETLELSANLKTEQVKNWMDALPPHYALVKFRLGADSLPQVKRYLVMYFKDYAVRDQMIERINDSMTEVETYRPNEINTYVNKHAVTVDGNTFDAFDASSFLTLVNKEKAASGSDLSGDEMYLTLGSPRLMERMKLAPLTCETRENLLLFTRAAEQACTASIMLSAIKSFKAQGGNVVVWAYGKNSLYRAYKNLFIENGCSIVEDFDAICDSIYALKQDLIAKKTSNTLFVLVGMDRICMDFDFVDGSIDEQEKEDKPTIADVRKGFEERGASVQSEDQEAQRKYALKWMKKKKELSRQYAEEGLNQEEIKERLVTDELNYRKELGIGTIASDSTDKPSDVAEAPSAPKKEEKKVHKAGAYNAKEDFVYTVKQGSRMGYHFFLSLNAFSDLKQCGLKRDYFRYRLAFQLSVEESRNVFDKKIASSLPEHICQYDDTLEKYSFRPFLHKGIGWDGWSVNPDGTVVNPYAETEG